MNLSKLLPPEISKLDLDTEIKSVTDLIVARVNPAAIFLFGSAVNGPRSQGSDIDICLVFDDSADLKQMRCKLFAMPLSEMPVDVLLYGRSEFLEKAAQGGVCQIIFEKGKLLHGEDIGK